MKPLNEKDYSLFQSLAGLTQKELRATMTSFLKSKYKNVIAKNEFIIAVGEIPIALVAHMDTVFKAPPTKIFYDEKKNSIEVAVLGSSQLVYGISCMRLLENYGISAYSLATGEQPVLCGYFYLREMTRRQNIKTVIYQ